MCGVELQYVKDAFDTNWIAPLGPHVDAFENEIAAHTGVEHAAALSSGTAAIHLALVALGVGVGDIVLCQDLTFAASANPIMYQHAVPVFIDSENESWNMCPRALEIALKKYPHAKAVITVNLYGVSANYKEIIDVCNAAGVPIIEDAAESLGSTYEGVQTGSFGRIGILSFNGNKIITTSGGGMLLCNNEEIVKHARFLATQSRDTARHYQHSQLGYNYRMSNVCAAIGRGQLTILNDRIKKKTEIFHAYREAFTGNKWICMNPIPPGCESNYWLSCIILAPDCPILPIAIIEKLENENIEARHIWKPMSLQPFYENCDFITADSTPVGHDIFIRGLCLPSDVKMTPQEQMKVSEIILEMLNVS
jgi:dTDP-4-amino-4,6-dideoxygalactose transaminase